MTTKQLLSSNSYIQYPKFLGYHIGVNCAILLSALCDKDSWCEHYMKEYDGWFYYFREEILLETGLSESQQRTALKELMDLQIVDCKNKGIPAKKYYHLDTEMIETLLENASNAYKIQMLKNCTSRDEEITTSRDIENSDSTIYKNIENKNNKEKTPAAPVSSPKHSRNFRKETEKLTDDLASGEEIKKQTEERKKKKPKDEQCRDMIDDTIYTAEVKEKLKEYFNWNYNSKSPKKVKGTSDWSQKLQRLEQLVKKGGDPLKIVQCALDNQWYGFFEPTQSTEPKSKFGDDDIIQQELHGEEVKKELERRTEVFL